MRQRDVSFPYKYASPGSAAGIQAASAEKAAEAEAQLEETADKSFS